MRKLAWLLLLVCATRATAQTPEPEAILTPEAAADIVALFNQPGTIRLNGDSHIAAGSELSGTVAVLEGTLRLAGRVRGDLVLINGNLEIETGAQVDGSVTVVGGTIHGAEALPETRVTVYRERLKYELRDGELVLMREVRADELSAGRSFRFGRTDVLVATDGAYNRSEGLPIRIGGRLTLGHSNPTLIEARYVLRTAEGIGFDEHDFGHALIIDQFIGGRLAARVGVRFASEVLPVELWGLSDREASLAAFVLHRDYRDHYLREGWAAYVAGGRRGIPFDWRIEYGNFSFQGVELRDPFSLLHNDDAWRPELSLPSVRLHTLRATSDYDTRNDDRDPSSGWLVRGDVDVGVSLRSGTVGFPDSYRFGLIDVRRYARLSPNARISMRAVAAGSLDGDALPSFRQQSLGGEGSMPGYALHRFDCGGHDSTTGAVPYYGCDRLMLFQVEYQSNFRWLSRLGRGIGRDFGLVDNIKWLLFFDTGRTWNEGSARGARGNGLDDFVADAGFGLRFGVLGAYWAVPLSARASGMNFFVRLRPRI